MSDCGKASRIAQQMASVPSVPTVDTEYVAKLLAEEASRRKKSYDSIGIAAYTKALPNTSPKEINKTFLANTIREVDSHNRREQIDDCWRAQRLNKKIERERSRKRRSRDECPRRDSYNDGGGRASDGREGEFDANNGDERAYWANLKAKKLKNQHIDQTDQSISFLPARFTQESHESDVILESKDEERLVDKKKKKSKDKKKKKKRKSDKKMKKKKEYKVDICKDSNYHSDSQSHNDDTST